MTKLIREEAPDTSTMFSASKDGEVGYYKMEGHKVMKHIEGFGWIVSQVNTKDLHNLHPTPHQERLMVFAALVLFWAFVVWVVLS